MHVLNDKLHQKLNSNVLRIRNRLVLDASLNPLDAYRETLTSCYDSDLDLRNFQTKAAEIREELNNWFDLQTNGKIQDLIPPSGIDAQTKMVLANAVYFKGEWEQEFSETLTTKVCAQTNSRSSDQYSAKSSQIYSGHSLVSTANQQ